MQNSYPLLAASQGIGFCFPYLPSHVLRLPRPANVNQKSRWFARSEKALYDVPRTRAEVIEAATAATLGLGVAIVGTTQSYAQESDEVVVTFRDDVLGMELEEDYRVFDDHWKKDWSYAEKCGLRGAVYPSSRVRFKGSTRVLVKRLVPGGPAAATQKIKEGMVLVSANGNDLERSTAAAAKKLIKDTPRPVTMVLRDSGRFNELLAERSTATPRMDGDGEPGGVISSKIAPKGDGQEEQVLRVTQITKGPGCETCVGAKQGDLLEIEYTARLEDGTVFDGSSIKVNGREVPGRGGDTTIFFVLGRQPKGQFPPGWDLSLVGMCVGEQRTVSIPPLVGYGASGMALRGVPAGATLLYNVKLIGVNGVNMCATQ